MLGSDSIQGPCSLASTALATHPAFWGSVFCSLGGHWVWRFQLACSGPRDDSGCTSFHLYPQCLQALYPTRLGLEEELRDGGVIEQQAPTPACPGHCPRSGLTYRDPWGAFLFPPEQAPVGHLVCILAGLGRTTLTPKAGVVVLGHQTWIWRSGNSVGKKAFRMEMQATSLGCPLEGRWDLAGESWKAAWWRR